MKEDGEEDVEVCSVAVHVLEMFSSDGATSVVLMLNLQVRFFKNASHFSDLFRFLVG